MCKDTILFTILDFRFTIAADLYLYVEFSLIKKQQSDIANCCVKFVKVKKFIVQRLDEQIDLCDANFQIYLHLHCHDIRQNIK